jgi:hypothetical protein
LDGVVINAGIVSPPLPLVDMTLDRHSANVRCQCARRLFMRP